MASSLPTEFRIPGGWGYPIPYAAAVFGSQLWFIGSEELAGMRQLTLQLVDTKGEPLDIENHVADKASWSSSELEIPGAKRPPLTMSRCGVAAVGDALHLVWNSLGEGSALRASRYTMSGDGQLGWQQAVTLAPQGDPTGLVAAPEAEVSVTGLGDDTLLVACPNVRPWWLPPRDRRTTIYIGTFKVNEIPKGTGTWRAHSDIWGGPGTRNPPFGPDYDFPQIPNQFAVDSFTAPGQGGPSDEPAARAPSSYLWVQFPAHYPSTECLLEAVPLVPRDITAGSVDYAIDYANRLSCQFAALPWWPGSTSVRDPAGRVRMYASFKQSRAVYVATFSTYSPFDPGSETPPLPFRPSGIKTAGLSDAPPTAAFVTQFPKTPVEAKYTYTDEHGNTHTITGTEYPVYEFVVYGNDHAYCQVDRFGTAQVFPDIPAPGHAKPKRDDMIIPSGIIDGPIPIPGANLADASDDGFGTVTYSATQTTAIDHSVSNSFTRGFMSEGESTKGLGPAWDISLKRGMGYLKTDGTTTSLSDSKQQEASLDGAKNLIPDGTVWGAEATFLWTAYRFLDANGNPVADSFDAGSAQAPLFTTVSCSFVPQTSANYVPYAVTPGHLDSYTPERWNERMAQLGFSGNYFQEVIEQHAYPFSETQNYLAATWTKDSKGQQGFEAATTDFIETSWTLDGELYVGLSGGEGVSFFGTGWEESFKFLVGMTYSHEASTTKEVEKAWGIALSDQWGPPYPGDNVKAAANSYSFRIYFLPAPPADNPEGLPPNYWVTELKKYAKDDLGNPLDPSIDENACAWKIVFVVTHYKFNDGTSYDYPGDRRQVTRK